MIGMSKNFMKSIVKYLFFVSLVFSFSSCALIQWLNSDSAEVIVEDPVFEKAEALVFASECEKAIPLLQTVLNKNDKNYPLALLYMGRSYDQTAEPEKAILSLQELVKYEIDSMTELKARALLLKNYSKVGADIFVNPEKTKIYDLAMNHEGDSIVILENLKWALEFRCDQFCVAEINFLKEIQLQLVYIIEKDEVSAERAAETLKTKYYFFKHFLSKEYLKPSVRKEMAVALLESYKRLEQSQLAIPSAGAVRTAKLVNDLTLLSKDIESWLYR